MSIRFFFFFLFSSSDLAFDLEGYTFILLNNMCTAASGVYTKKKLEVEVTVPQSAPFDWLMIQLKTDYVSFSCHYGPHDVQLLMSFGTPHIKKSIFYLLKGLGKYGVLFYNASIIVIPTVLASFYSGDLQQVQPISDGRHRTERGVRVMVVLIYLFLQVLTFEHWTTLPFVCSFLMSCVMG